MAGDADLLAGNIKQDVDPTVPGNALRITSITQADGKVDVGFTPASTRRCCTLARRESLTDGDWSNVVGQSDVSGDGGEQTLADEEPATTMFYDVTVTVSP